MEFWYRPQVLRTLQLKNIRGFASAKIDLEPLTVFVGTNGSGKTTILECVDVACRASQMGGSVGIFHDRLDPKNVLSRNSASGIISVEADGGREQVEIQSHTIRRGVSEGDLPRSTILRLVPEKLSSFSLLKAEVPSLADDGTGLAALLDYLIGLRDGSIERIEDDLRTVVPQAGRLRVLPTMIERRSLDRVDKGLEFFSGKKAMGSRFELEFGKMGFIPARALSEGTLIALGLLAVIHRAGDTPTVALFDDLDRGLHPRAQTELIGKLRALVEQRENLQLLCTTHSTYALDAFSAKEAHVTWVDDDGVSYHRRLSEHPEWPRWESLMAPGEFWSSVGEAWVGGAQESA